MPPSQGSEFVLEESLIHATFMLLQANRTLEDWDRAYIAALKSALSEGNLNILAFYAFGLLGLNMDLDSSTAEGMQALLDVRKLLLDSYTIDKEAWDHPGILHATIHAFDFDDVAYLGLPAARAYSDVAATSTHAIHMPSHIFYRFGFWLEGRTHNVHARS